MTDYIAKIKEPKYCNKCGKNMVSEDGKESLEGLQIKISAESAENEQFFIDQMYPYKLDKIYSICFPCWLDSFGIKP